MRRTRSELAAQRCVHTQGKGMDLSLLFSILFVHFLCKNSLDFIYNNLFMMHVSQYMESERFIFV